MKPTRYVVNVARGGLIDEDALYDGAHDRRDRRRRPRRLHRASRPTRTRRARLLDLPNVVVTPHLGASTDEAQEKAGVSVARSVRLALEGELVPDAVNVAGGVIDPYVRPGIPLVEKLGQFFAGLAHARAHEPRRRGARRARRLRRQRATARRAQGHLHEHRERDRLVRERAAARRAARHRDAAHRRGRAARSTATSSRCAARCRDGTQLDGRRARSPGTQQIEKLVGINGYEIEVPIEQHHIVMVYTDRPGIVAIYGQRVRRGGHQHRGHADRAPRRRRPGALGADGRLAGARRAARRGARGDRGRPVPPDRDHRALSLGAAFATVSACDL